MAHFRHDSHRLYWWDRDQPGPTGKGIVHLVASDQTLPPMASYPGHSTYCGAVKFPGRDPSRERPADDEDLLSYRGLEPFPVGETPESVDRPVCDDCAAAYRDIVRSADERGASEAVERFLWEAPSDVARADADADPEAPVCLLREFATDCGATGVEYAVAEYLCRRIRLGAIRPATAFDGIRFNDPRAAFGDAVCPDCATAYEADIWSPITEQSQVVVTLLADREEIDGEISPHEERLRERIERSKRNADACGPLRHDRRKLEFDDLHATAIACTSFEILSDSRVRLTNSLGRTRTFHQAEILDLRLEPAQQVIY